MPNTPIRARGLSEPISHYTDAVVAGPGRTIYVYSDWGKVYALEPLPTERGERFALDETFDGWTT